MSVTPGGLTGRHLIASVFQVTSVLHGERWHIGHKTIQIGWEMKISCWKYCVTRKQSPLLQCSPPEKVFYFRLCSLPFTSIQKMQQKLHKLLALCEQKARKLER